MANQNLLHNAFVAFMRYYVAKHSGKPKKKRPYLRNAYTAFLKGNWTRLKEERPNKVTKTFGTM